MGGGRRAQQRATVVRTGEGRSLSCSTTAMQGDAAAAWHTWVAGTQLPHGGKHLLGEGASRVISRPPAQLLPALNPQPKHCLSVSPSVSANCWESHIRLDVQKAPLLGHGWGHCCCCVAAAYGPVCIHTGCGSAGSRIRLESVPHCYTQLDWPPAAWNVLRFHRCPPRFRRRCRQVNAQLHLHPGAGWPAGLLLLNRIRTCATHCPCCCREASTNPRLGRPTQPATAVPPAPGKLPLLLLWLLLWRCKCQSR